MSLEVHVLGTASARPTPDRAVSGSLVKGPNGIAVIDAGEGFQTRYAHQRRSLKRFAKGTTLKPRDVDVLAFTHGHLDHTWGAFPWLQSMDLEHREAPLLIIGPTSTDMADALLEGTGVPEHLPPAELGRQWLAWFSLGAKSIRFPIRWVLGDLDTGRWVELDPLTGRGSLLDGMPQPNGWSHSTLRPLATSHSVPSCGWLIEQNAKPGSFDRARADELGLSSKQRAMLARGEDVTGDVGTTLEAAWFRGEEHPPISVLISGDTASTPSAWTSDVAPTLLVHEATFLEAQRDKAEEHLHSTSSGAVASARTVGASYLALTHFSNRIKDANTSLEEARNESEGLPVVALNDGDRLLLYDDGSLVHHSCSKDGWGETSIAPNR